MSRCVLHLGAHRTGTTYLQEFMYRRRDRARGLGIHLIEITECRKNGFLDGVVYRNSPTKRFPSPTQQKHLFEKLKRLVDTGNRAFLSDENILGTMEENVQCRSLYPSVGKSVSRLGRSIELFDTVCLSVRPIPDWWRSTYQFLAQQGASPIELSQAARETTVSTQSWSGIVEEILEVFPNARIIIRDFPAHIANPKRQLREFTGWPEVKDLKNIEPKKANASTEGERTLRKYLSKTPWESEYGEAVDGFAQEMHLDDLRCIKGLIRGRGRVLVA